MAETTLGTADRPIRVAVFGSGPSGYYAAEELLIQKDTAATVDVFDRLPTPYGLVRGGVAPDHQKIKSVANFFEKTSARPGFRYFGNVEYGRDLTLAEVLAHYDAVVFAVGAKSDNRMGIPGEDLIGSHPATELVGWYNAHPDYRDLKFDLSQERVAVIGNGNVAMDVIRILAQDPDHLAPTDIASYALDALRKSGIKEIYMIGRRGSAQAAYTNPEIEELCELPGADLVVTPETAALDPLSQAALDRGDGGGKAKKNVAILQAHAPKPLRGEKKRIVVRFLMSPVEVYGKDGKVTGLKLERNQLVDDGKGGLKALGTKTYEDLQVGLVFRSVGYKGTPLADLPYDERKGTIPNQLGRIIDAKTSQAIPRLYVVGWAKRGPSGVIGTNKPDSVETVRNLLADLKGKQPETGDRTPEAVHRLLTDKKVKFVTFGGWKKLDAIEVAEGKAKGKVREKVTDIPAMLAAIDGAK